MEVKQIAEITNEVTKEVLGSEAVVNEDLSNIVDIGTQIFNAEAVDNYVRKLVDRIGRVVFVNRPYRGSAPSVLRTGWEYGAVMQKVRANLPVATENESWELTDGTSYDPNIFTKPDVSNTFYNKRVTFEIPMSFTNMQVKSAFANAGQMNGFMEMIYNEIDKSMTVKLDSLIMRTINNMTAETLHSEFNNAVYTGVSGVKAINLLHLYNTRYGTNLTAEQAITTPEFIRFASYTMGVYARRLGSINKLFNIAGDARFTPADLLHIVMLADFEQAANVYLQSDTFHDEFTKLPNAESVPFWQGSGTAYDFASISGIDVKDSAGDIVKTGGILAVMFDRDALGVCCEDRHTTAQRNEKAEFTNMWFKYTANYFNATDEQFILFYVA